MTHKFDKLKFLFHSGKNCKAKYYLYSYLRFYLCPSICRFLLSRRLNIAEARSDYGYLVFRRDYYCKLYEINELGSSAIDLRSLRIEGQKVYVFDTQRYTRFFNPDLKISLLPGDITYVPPTPSIVKSRPLTPGNSNSVVLNLDRVRHFIFVHDKIQYEDKSDRILFRGKVGHKDARIRFMRQYFGHPAVDAGDVDRRCGNPIEWRAHKLTIYDQLRYKFIMAIEGNDVASNLKWIMSSNSIVVMPRPTCETWFMEGLLMPDYHYIEVRPDFSDLIEKVTYYINHPEKAKVIIANAKRYVSQFMDSKREDLISLMVLDKYFKLTGQYEYGSENE